MKNLSTGANIASSSASSLLSSISGNMRYSWKGNNEIQSVLLVTSSVTTSTHVQRTAFLTSKLLTRGMHTSRMRTARFSGSLYQGGVCLWVWGECLPLGLGCTTPPWTHTPFHHTHPLRPPSLPWTEWITDACENITLPQSSFVKKLSYNEFTRAMSSLTTISQLCRADSFQLFHSLLEIAQNQLISDDGRFLHYTKVCNVPRTLWMSCSPF